MTTATGYDGGVGFLAPYAGLDRGPFFDRHIAFQTAAAAKEANDSAETARGELVYTWRYPETQNGNLGNDPRVIDPAL